MDDSPLPSGLKVFTTCPELLFIWELVLGAPVWILIALSQVPLPLVQGWVMVVSVFCFVGTTALLFLYLTGANKGNIPWVSLDGLFMGNQQPTPLPSRLHLPGPVGTSYRPGGLGSISGEQGPGDWPWLPVLTLQDTAYHCIAALFYLSASFLEALATISMEDSVTYEQYLENISAAMFSYIATLLYVVHAVFSVVRWKWPLLDDS
ncbi:PREDICTED: myelin and lymphocyte protein-like [Ceratotherium simum simum]|uniref:Myelin and lymphocyte protein-like n=1 Tax=Ceratotherium simum simum TaxID=73337 RepID=A0ABM1D5I0_CERSS|nr:PREDICTED: myelin and lymphocyte protein-like [Ceratotherium simum simum]